MATNKSAAPFFIAQQSIRGIIATLQDQVVPNVDEDVTGGSPEYAERVQQVVYDLNELAEDLAKEVKTVRDEVMNTRRL